MAVTVTTVGFLGQVYLDIFNRQPTRPSWRRRRSRRRRAGAGEGAGEGAGAGERAGEGVGEEGQELGNYLVCVMHSGPALERDSLGRGKYKYKQGQGNQCRTPGVKFEE